MIDIILTIVLLIISIGLFVIALFQFNEKGFLLNNIYIYASKEERDKLNKKPYYKQSGIVFVLLSIIFLLNALGVLFKLSFLYCISIVVAVIAIIYAIVSSLKIK